MTLMAGLSGDAVPVFRSGADRRRHRPGQSDHARNRADDRFLHQSAGCTDRSFRRPDIPRACWAAYANGLLEAYAHQEVPFPKIVQEVQPERSATHNPIVQVLFVMQNIPRAKRELAGLQLGALRSAGRDLEVRHGGLRWREAG